jgi:ribonuclease HII
MQHKSDLTLLSFRNFLFASLSSENYHNSKRSAAEAMKGILTDTVVVGIDEAGLGPILGPLIVSAACFTVSVEKHQTEMWQLLSQSVSSNKKHLAGRLLICDSKKAYTPSTGMTFLERTVLSCLSCIGKTPTSITELIDILCPDSIARLLRYPWHKDLSRYRIEFNRDDIAIAAAAFNRNLEKNSMSLLALKSFCFDVAFYNDMVGKVNNKSTVLFMAVCSLIDQIIKGTPHKKYHFVIDRQGGRTRYTRQLRTMFPEMELKVLDENNNISSYELSAESQPSGSGIKNIRIDFAVKADASFLPACLASMVSKYLREQLMNCINSYFVEKCRNLKPTAGYWNDGKRFINDLKQIAPHIQFDPNQLIRCR